MAELDGMNMTANMAYATESGALDATHETEGIGRIGSTLATGTGGFDDLDVAVQIVTIVTSITGPILTSVITIIAIYECRRKYGHRRGHRQQSPTPEEEIELNPSNVGPEPTAECEPLTNLGKIQERVQAYNKDTVTTIPAHPLDPSRTLDIDQFSELELKETLDSNERTQEPIRLAEGIRNLDKVRTKPQGSLEDVLVTKLRILLSGGAGFGKSTLLLKVTNASTDPTSPMAKFKLVFLVKLKHMQQTCCILEAIRDQILPGINKADLKKIIDQNEKDTAFLLDGLDEIPTDVLNSPAPEGGYGVMDVLHNKVLRQSTVLVSTRPHMNHVAVNGYPHYTCVQTLGFTFETAKKYITSYFAGKNATNSAVSLISHTTSRASLQTLAQIPIMVLFMCIVWENQSKLPEKLTALYTDFTEALVSRRCNEDEDKEVLITSVLAVLRGLGSVALSGLLDSKGERLVFTSDDFDDKKALEDGCQLGFLQKESMTSGLKKMQVVVFLHKSIQEYLAGYYLAHLHDTDENKFHEELEKIKPKNIHAMKDLLRFACGIHVASGSEATGLILQHVQKQKERVWYDDDHDHDGDNGDGDDDDDIDGDVLGIYRRDDDDDDYEEMILQNLARLLVFESGSKEMAEKLDRPTKVNCFGQENLLAMQYHLTCLRQPGILEFTVCCQSHEELVELRNLYNQVHGNLAENNELDITCRSHDDLKLLQEILKYIGTSLRHSKVIYIMSEQGNKALQTLEEILKGMDEGLRGRLDLTLVVDEPSHFALYSVSRSLSHVCSQIDRIELRKQANDDVIGLGMALDMSRCIRRLKYIHVIDTDLHGHLSDVTPLVSQSLHWLTLESCGLDDKDIPDLIRILPTGHGVESLDVTGNAFSAGGVEKLTAHLKKLPDLGKSVYGL